ncbi:hypothetical protein ACHHRT_11170 [Desulfurivibrio sp. D14AmB]|uniref:hypothetical protein n=1 Tax=Desulfurivibrio sp. D14AmB TaxID=3374370 RepID=UPI00376F3CC2
MENLTMGDDKKGKKDKELDKKLCKLAKSDFLTDSLKEYIGLVSKGKYLCRKCGRVAGRKKNLCKAEAL